MNSSLLKNPSKSLLLQHNHLWKCSKFKFDDVTDSKWFLPVFWTFLRNALILKLSDIELNSVQHHNRCSLCHWTAQEYILTGWQTHMCSHRKKELRGRNRVGNSCDLHQNVSIKLRQYLAWMFMFRYYTTIINFELFFDISFNFWVLIIHSQYFNIAIFWGIRWNNT